MASGHGMGWLVPMTATRALVWPWTAAPDEVYVTRKRLVVCTVSPSPAPPTLCFSSTTATALGCGPSVAGSDGTKVFGVALDSATVDIYMADAVSGSVHSQTYVVDFDIILLNYSSNGTGFWSRIAGTVGYDRAFGAAVESITGYVFVSGNVAGSLHGEAYGGGCSDMLLLRYSGNGTRVWTRLVSTNGNLIAYGLAMWTLACMESPMPEQMASSC
ncbi:hypothetical protein EON65_32155 [archaeon]|nr:MAG: hypothetical protein EON65_32155 [archaeon]